MPKFLPVPQSQFKSQVSATEEYNSAGRSKSRSIASTARMITEIGELQFGTNAVAKQLRLI